MPGRARPHTLRQIRARGARYRAGRGVSAPGCTTDDAAKITDERWDYGRCGPRVASRPHAVRQCGAPADALRAAEAVRVGEREGSASQPGGERERAPAQPRRLRGSCGPDDPGQCVQVAACATKRVAQRPGPAVACSVRVGVLSGTAGWSSPRSAVSGLPRRGGHRSRAGEISARGQLSIGRSS